MLVEEIMTKKRDLVWCTPDTLLGKVAALMCDRDCGCIPVVASKTDHKVVGVITDRDIVCRALARGKNPLSTTAADCMSNTPITVGIDTPVKECCTIMATRHVRRVVIVDEEGECCGIVALSDLAGNITNCELAEVAHGITMRATESTGPAVMNL